jgi:putative CocE/NonD family hydrolase
MSQQSSSPSTQKRYLWLLGTLLFLFCLRVLGQVLVAFFGVKFLPPMEEWFSGLLPYPELLTSQILIILLYGKICLDFARGRGYFVTPGRRLGINLLKFGWLYLGVMIIRYVIRMGLYPHERWTGGSIPIFFHWVLASFLLVLGHYHWRWSAQAEIPGPKPRNLKARVLLWSQATLVGLGIVLWLSYQLAPSLLAHAIGLRRPQFAVRVQKHAVMTTTDGTELSSEIFHPQRTDRTPTILVRIPLSKTFKNSLFVSLVGRMWAERGYTAVIQGTRGRYESGGTFHPLHGERQDGIETLSWISKQPWFNGQIATWGGSAFGYTQWAISDQQAPGPSALAIYFASSDFHRMFYPGGAFSLYSALSWAGRSHGPQDLADFPPAKDLYQAADGFPLIDADRRLAGQEIPFFRDWAQHPERDSFWIDIDGTNRSASLKAPVLLMAGWYDPFLPSQLDDFMQIRRSPMPSVSEHSRLIIGPWTHAGEVVFPNGVQAENFRRQSLAVSLPWFDQTLQSSQSQSKDPSPVRIFVMGKNEWRSETEWPLSRARATSLYLGSGGKANSAAGDGRLDLAQPLADEPADSFRYDPLNPVPTAGGAMIGSAAGIARQNPIESRNDVLVYTTAALQNDIEVTGPIALVLYASTSAANTDFTAKLVDVHPDGSAYNVSDGIVRRSYSGPAGAAGIQEIRIELWPTSMVFFKRHRMRLEVSSSNFPRFARNPNTNNNVATETNPVSAIQLVHHGSRFPSRLVLPFVPAP